MNQTINILRKDARQLWPESVAALVILLLFAAVEPRSWMQMDSFVPMVGPVSSVLAGLLFVNWGILIIRLVQAERMVGLNQFWTTRPYEWRKLIAAKALFLLLFVYLPLALVQLLLLHHAHLPVFENIPLLLLNLLLLTAIFVLPFACFAALTASFAQAMLALLGTAVLWVITSSFDTPRFKELTPHILGLLQYAVLVTVLIAALLHQYWRRRTLRSLAIIVFAPGLMLLVQVAVPGTSLAARSYVPADAPPISIQFDHNPVRKFGGAHLNDPKAMFYLHLPLLASQIAPGTSYSRDAERVTLTGANGYTWQSTWFAKEEILAPDGISPQFTTYAEYFIPRTVYDRLSSGSVTVHIDFALQQLQDQPPIQEAVSTSGDWVPGLGFCALDEGYGTIHCGSAFRDPNYFAVSTVMKIRSCQAPPEDTEPAHAIVGAPHLSPVALHISPVVMTRLQLHFPAQSITALCPGAPITFIRKMPQRRLRVEMPTTTIVLKDYLNSISVR
jgi:hypothetical protein